MGDPTIKSQVGRVDKGGPGILRGANKKKSKWTHIQIRSVELIFDEVAKPY